MDESKTPVELNPIAECLRAAREIIKTPERWWNGIGHEAVGRDCAWTALLRVKAPTMAHSIFSTVIGDPSIQSWNDTPGRTHAEVLAAFDKAIQLAEAQHG
jgi:hypothetical protein